MAGNIKISQKKKIQDLKLNALLEVTKAIYNNYHTPQLLELYEEILEHRLGVGKLVLFYFDEEWKNILQYGLRDNTTNLKFDKELLSIKEIETITYTEKQLHNDFEIVIPVYHKKTALAYLLLGDVDQQKLELSASIKHLPYVQTLTNIIVVAIENKKLYKEHVLREQLNKELELAQNMQQMLFPKELPQSETLNVAAKYIPHEQVGGDYYDFIQINNHEFIFCMADVSGKGVAAALLMSNIQATLHSLINYTHDLKNIIIELNKRVITNTNHEKFLSIFLARLSTKSQQMTYINAGHNPPLLYYNQKFQELDKGCILLGIDESIQNIEFTRFEYSSDFTLLCYTDGLTDTANSNDENLSIDAVKEIILQNPYIKPSELNEKIYSYANYYRDGNSFPDDIALLTLKVGDLGF